jgi:S-adenosylmethionine-diacylgycerolhomoserine-N-methlytransferase
VLSEASTLWRLARGMPRHGEHAARLQAFYAPQAPGYDPLRERMLHGRRELAELLDPRPGARVVELGAGTGRNLEFFGDRLATLSRVYLVDLCPALLARARERWRDRANVTVVEADACRWRAEGPVDVAFLSYSLTMIPDWRAAIDNAVTLLAPGGRLGVVDFTLPPPAHALARTFWRAWFAHAGVHLDDRHLAHLRERLPNHRVREAQGPLPYLPVLKAPYYLFVGHGD